MAGEKFESNSPMQILDGIDNRMPKDLPIKGLCNAENPYSVHYYTQSNITKVLCSKYFKHLVLS